MQFKIANVLLEESRQFFNTPKLYVRAGGEVFRDADGQAWTLDGPASYDFTTFFNALSVYKWNMYTVATGYVLHLELKGAACTVTQTHTNKFSYYVERDGANVAKLDASDGWQAVDLDISVRDEDVLDGFIIDCEGPVQIRNSYYSAEVPEGGVRPVELALSTTTFKKEAYIEHNIELVRTRILATDELIARHFRMYVVDNGSTLDAEKLSSDGVTVYPNANVGGSGGFAFGMIKALEDGAVTNILLMDDDVEVSPESIIRTFNLLSIVNDEYEDAFISGAMMNFDEPDQRWEDTGHMSVRGNFMPNKPPMRVGELDEAIRNETYTYDTESYEDLTQMYAGWWYCCIPMSMVRKNGLPLEFFVRFDDAEYALRCKPKFMTMNGICIWHLVFYMKYSAAVERYQVTRNTLTGQAITGVAGLCDFFKEIENEVVIDLAKFDYDDAALVCEGLEDFLKGPETFSQKGFVEKRFMDANKNKEKMIPFSELAPQAKEELGVDIYQMNQDMVEADIPIGGTPHDRAYELGHRAIFRWTLNGQITHGLKPFREKYAVIDGRGWTYQVGKLYGVDTVLALNMQAQQGIIRHRDNARGKQVWERYQKDVKRYKAEKDALEARYRAARPRLTSVDYWKDYLGLA